MWISLTTVADLPEPISAFCDLALCCVANYLPITWSKEGGDSLACSLDSPHPLCLIRAFVWPAFVWSHCFTLSLSICVPIFLPVICLFVSDLTSNYKHFILRLPSYTPQWLWVNEKAHITWAIYSMGTGQFLCWPDSDSLEIWSVWMWTCMPELMGNEFAWP